MIDRAALSVREVAERLGIRRHGVLSLLHSGALRAIDVSLTPGGRPTWRIMGDDLDTFITNRTHVKSPPRRRKKKRPMVKTYF